MVYVVTLLSPLLGLKPALILNRLRGAEAPLFHGCACIRDFQQPVAPWAAFFRRLAADAFRPHTTL